LLDDGGCPAEAGIGRANVAQALVIALLIVMPDERLGLGFQVPWQAVVFRQDAVLQALRPAFDLASYLRKGAPRMDHLAGLDVIRQFALGIFRPQ